MAKPGGAPPRKAPGTAISPVNGQRAVLTTPGERFDPPSDITAPEALDAWEGYWEDPVSSVATVTDHALLVRWVNALDRYWRLMREADDDPIVHTTANGQLPNPLYKVALAQGNQIERMEVQLGIGPRNRAKLGIQVIGVEKGRQELERGSGPSQPALPEEDPRFA